MSDFNASLYDVQNTQSVFLKFFSESVKLIEKQINNTASLNFFTTEQIDFIVLICDQFQKLVNLRSKSKLIDNLLTYNFPELFKTTEERNIPLASKFASNGEIEPIKKGAENHYSFVCDDCEEDIPILNNDLDFSTQSHLSSPYHLEVVSVLRQVKKSEACASSVASSSSNSTLTQPQSASEASSKDLPNGNEFASQAVVSNSRSTSSSKRTPAPYTISKEEELFQRFAWIQSARQNQFLLWRGSQYYCRLCEAILPTQHNFDAHVKSYTHKTNVAFQREANGGSTLDNVQQCGKSRVFTTSRSSSCDNQRGISQVRTPKRTTSDIQSNPVIVNNNGVRVCTLCNVRLPSEANFVSHTNSFAHRTKIGVYLKTFNALTNALNDVTDSAARASFSSSPAKVKSTKNETSNASQDFLVTCEGIQCCSLCDVMVPGKAQQDSHFSGSFHQEQLQTFTKRRASTSFTDFIITKDNGRYCVLCNINLPGVSQMTAHKYGRTHKQKLKDYEEKHPRQL